MAIVKPAAFPNHIRFTRSKLDELKRVYTFAVHDRRETLTFEGRTMVTGYAKYVIEYVESMLGRTK